MTADNVAMYMNDVELLSLCASDPKQHEGGPSELWEKVTCGRAYHLNRQYPEDTLAENCSKRNTGSITHKIVEYYHRGLSPDDFISRRADNSSLATSLETAWLIADQYIGQYQYDFWGKLLAAEVRPGGRPGRLDAVFNADAEAVARIEGRFAVNLSGPGVYVWDLKTAGQRDAHLSTRYEWGPACYMYLNSALTEWPGTKGMIFFNAVPHNNKRGAYAEFYAAYYPIESQTSETAHRRHTLMVCQAEANVSEETGHGLCNSAACYAHGKPCRHRLTGVCEGV